MRHFQHLGSRPTLIGEFLELRPLAHTDFEELFTAASDPLIWELHPESGRYQHDVFKIYFDSAMESKGAFAILEKSSGRIIGSSRYFHFYPERSEIEIGYTFLTRPFWGGRYNRELKSLMIEHAFGFVNAVVFYAGEKNLRSRKALEKIGAREYARVEKQMPDGQVSVSIGYRIDKNEWRDVRKRLV